MGVGTRQYTCLSGSLEPERCWAGVVSHPRPRRVVVVKVCTSLGGSDSC